MEKLEQETKRDCKYYDWNDNPDYSSYSPEYGAMCHESEEFFSRDNGFLNPNCPTCDFYDKRIQIDS